MKKLLIYLKGYKRETILAPLFKLLEASFELLVPLVMAAVIDKGIAGQDRPYIVRMCLVLVTLGIVGLACSITAQYFAAKAATGFSAALRHSLFEHIQNLSFTEMDRVGNSTLITRMTSDVNQVQSGVNLVLRLFLRSPFIVFGAMIMAFTVDVKAALVFVVTIPLLSIVVFGVMLISMPLYRKVQANLDKVLLVTRENLSGSRVVRAFNKEEEERERFEECNQTLTDAQKFVGRISGLMNPLTYILVNGGIIVLIYVGALRVDSGVLTQGQVVALINYMSQILVELVKLANLIITVTKAIACGNRIQNVFEMHSEMEDGLLEAGDVAAEEREAVVFEHVSLTYKEAGAESLSDISFRALRGETIGIIGGTGSGKSSLVNLIPRFYDATKGRILVDGRDVKDYKLEVLRDKIGVVMQKAVLFKGTIAENLRWGKGDATEAELLEALVVSQAKEFVDTKEGGLAFKVEQGGRNLSGGQKQRLTIARALVRKPEILILDDSASALDFATDARLRRAIQEMEDSPTVFIVSQRAASIQYADKIVVLDDGVMAGIGTHQELLESCPTYQEIYYSQFPKEAGADGR
ncbi:ABC transporter ATP-binding protein/permease [Bariatricus massiliensis]|uniref:ABC transporter ATP-binding protein/permease n=1 Tax=Bariatricus massiliensis TaxID=1745713 RepID=A0ABS8DEY8_9FIRM|nr:ABC transporter ATP-binding protein [Bariatricus massiliensis]MCB7303100.1 ABC transporter ATP-binding protein/permease [Bariatricus massiliensis]MCB7374316.1 ABC transporter ATP-binding protein/permease [Bariatricus massiliensis]MCB7386986.1 ABC transporter ATP-binding protein/permease [Bariatricus massiliensis]MCB7411148.1 ABC transporter ATP-binding protein/permease [Bariatricus massiliensis]MCQ5251974.1 ABC transporter ATP-binding protein/permease [Bariatricus massiliensis]